ncbi:hypothetical protein CCR75_002024 [Bremia lactucae]|uniref:Uncharacterized protein n=1 Tax=Bremia lactucae TaxID=4779 RepID=A0A976IBQ9_BRELC|nr:hypothetical protein CCR75_002024 [Bremia lactucae]
MGITKWIVRHIVKQHRAELLKRHATHLVASRSDQYLLLQYAEDIPTLTHMYTQEHKDFWATYRWDRNPWLVNDKGVMLSAKEYPLLNTCTLAEIHIQRGGIYTGLPYSTFKDGITQLSHDSQTGF